MSETPNELGVQNFNKNSSELAFRHVQFGKIYDRLEPNKPIDISVFGGVYLEIDDENLGLEKVTLDNLKETWETQKDIWIEQCKNLNTNINPFEIFKYYHIQRKAFSILGKVIPESEGRRRDIYKKFGERAKLSELKGNAMCSEYAVLCGYIAQKIGEPIHLIIGASVDNGDESKWRGAHAFLWVDGLDVVFDGSMAQGDNEYPAIMQPTSPATLETMEDGFDVLTKRIGTEFLRVYGLGAGGFGIKLQPGL